MTKFTRIKVDYRYPKDGTAIVYAKGCLDDEMGTQIVKAVDELVGQGTTFILVDMSGSDSIDVEFMMSLLIETIARLLQADGRLGFCGLATTVAQTFEVTALDAYAQIYPDEETALASVGIQPRADPEIVLGST